MPHGHDCIVNLIARATLVTSLADFPAAWREAIGYTEPYVPPVGIPPLPENGSYGEHGIFTVDAGRLALRVTGKPPKPLCPFDGWMKETSPQRATA